MVKHLLRENFPSVFIKGLMLVLPFLMPALAHYEEKSWHPVNSLFADEHAVNKSFRAKSCEEEEETTTVIEDCMKSVKSWMDAVWLKMNSVKTEFIDFGNQKQISTYRATSLDVYGVKISRLDIIPYLRTWLDASLAMNDHIKRKCVTAMLNILKLKKMSGSCLPKIPVNH